MNLTVLSILNQNKTKNESAEDGNQMFNFCEFP